MRLKSSEGPLAVYNGNDPSIVNSPKRLNTVQSSNVTANLLNPPADLTSRNINSNGIINTETTTAGLTALQTVDNVVAGDVVQWCNPALGRELTAINNAKNNQQQLNNINNTLAASLRATKRFGTASSLCSESSPDDSLLDYEEAHQSCSSVDASPQDEDRVFDISDLESLSEEGNLLNAPHDTALQRRGIVNPNYPGFQHLAHTLEYGIKSSSDADLTDDDFDYDASKLNAEANNNNGEDVEYKIDSVNRLDSVENIQKVFYDKPVFNIPLQCDKKNNCDSGSNFNPSDDDCELLSPQIYLNIFDEEDGGQNIEKTGENIVGNFEKEVEEEFDRISIQEDHKELAAFIERTIEAELKEAIEKLSTAKDLSPTAIKYNIEPNTEQPFNKAPIAEVPSEVTEEEPNMAVSFIHIPQSNHFDHESKAKMIDQKITSTYNIKFADDIPDVPQLSTFFTEADLNANQKMEIDFMDSNKEEEEMINNSELKASKAEEHEEEKFCKEDKTKDDKEKDEDTVVPRKKEKMDHYVRKRRDYSQQFGSLITVPRRDYGGRSRDNFNRRSMPAIRDKKKSSPESLGSFDVYNIETAMPKIDLDAIESHLKAAREEERRRRTDREEIRRRLAMGSEEEYYSDRPGRKPSLQARLQSGMNLQICFMNETASDTDSPSSDSECPMTNPKEQRMSPKSKHTPNQPRQDLLPPVRPATLSIGEALLQPVAEPMPETDFFTRQARLQTEARMALAQAKEMARMQMELERQRQVKSPITEMVRHSLAKVGIPFPEERRRLSRQILTEMNVAQLQVIVNDLHTRIEALNEALVKYLMERDDLHMEQDSMLVDIEDLTRYLGAKEQTLKDKTSVQNNNNNNTPSTASVMSSPPRSPLAALNSSVKPHLHRIASLVKK